MTVPHDADRLRRDLATGGVIVVASVLLGAPAGLIWSALAPRYTIVVGESGPTYPNLESTKAFIGADGSYLLVVLVMGLLSGLLAWRLARRSGPYTVVALVLGGLLAALIAQSVGLRPGSQDAVQALQPGSDVRGDVELYLGKRDRESGTLSLRGDWAAVGWPVGAMVSFLVLAFRRPEELD